jgi:hypothetical protein
VTDPEPPPNGHPVGSGAVHHRAAPTGTTEMIVPLLARGIRDNVARFAAGEQLIGQVDPALGY